MDGLTDKLVDIMRKQWAMDLYKDWVVPVYVGEKMQFNVVMYDVVVIHVVRRGLGVHIYIIVELETKFDLPADVSLVIHVDRRGIGVHMYIMGVHVYRSISAVCH
ncbi:hypothetical protein Bca101_091838 [Brassica carinata]